LLRRAHARARANTAAALVVLGDLSPVQASALAALMNGPLTQAELGRRIEMEPANTHGLVKRLVAAKLVETHRSPENRRLSIVGLTEAGEAVTGRLEATLLAAARATLAPLNDGERRQLIDMLRRIALDPS
jgi:DNA-binding MarR family transcriptional regulator